jgi:hypothetical protein
MNNATPESKPRQNDSAGTAKGDDSPAAILEKQIAQSMPNMDAGLRKSLARLGASIAVKEAATTTADDKPNGQDVTLPPCPQDRRSAPNAVFRSALFPALNFKESRPFLKGERLASVEGVDVYFTGERFDQSDLDVYLEILHLAQQQALGTECTFSAYAMLKALGRSTGSSDCKWLHSVLIRLRGGTVDMADHGRRYFGGLIEGGFKDEVSKLYRVIINPNFAILFGYGMWASIDREQRHELGRNMTAKALHAYYSTHAAPYPHRFDTLAEIAGLTGKNTRDVKARIIKAHESLKDIGFLADCQVIGDSIKVEIKHTEGQLRHLANKAKNPRPKNPKGTG